MFKSPQTRYQLQVTKCYCPSIYVHPNGTYLYLIPTGFYSTTAAAAVEAPFETTQVVQCPAM